MTPDTEQVERELLKRGWRKLRVAAIGEVHVWQGPNDESFRDPHEAFATIREQVPDDPEDRAA